MGMEGQALDAQKITSIKMEALTIKTFKTSKISAVEVSKRHSKDFNCKSIKFTYDGGEVPPIRLDENFRIFKF